MEIRSTPKVSFAVTQSKLRLQAKQVVRRRSFQEHCRTRDAHCARQLRDHVHVVAHHRHFQQPNLVPLGGTTQACFASNKKLAFPQHLKAVFRAPLQMVHVLTRTVSTNHTAYLRGAARQKTPPTGNKKKKKKKK